MSVNEKTREQLIDELATLRQRIAELETLEAERKKTESMLRRLTELSDRTGIMYMQLIAAFIAGELGTEYVFIGKLEPDSSKVKTVAAYAQGRIIDNIEYDLHGTPCENVIGRKACVYPERIRELFPEDILLSDMKAESYAGIPLFASDGRPLGIIVALGCGPIKRAEMERYISFLQIFASRVSSELEREEAEDEIRRIESSLARAQQIAKIGNWDWNIETNELWWSDEIYRIFGLAPHEFSATYEAFLNAVHPDDREMVEKSVERALSENEPYSIDHRIVLPDGEEKIVHEEAVITRNERGRSMRMIGTVQDVTRFKHMEMQLQKSKEELEIKVEARTAELTSTVELLRDEIDRRRKIEEQLQQSLHEKEVLLKEIHHRVKNNMTVITSLLQLQAGHIDDRRYKEMFDHSISRIRSMALIHEKLYKSTDLSKVNFNDYLGDMIKSMYMSYGLSQEKVTLKTGVENVALRIDAAIPCGLIINELVSNSLKYAFPDDREGEITVSLRRKENSAIEMTVSDNGVGMPEDIDLETTDSLGLRLVTALARQLQGTVKLNREGGTEFKITFKR